MSTRSTPRTCPAATGTVAALAGPLAWPPVPAMTSRVGAVRRAGPRRRHPPGDPRRPGARRRRVRRRGRAARATPPRGRPPTSRWAGCSPRTARCRRGSWSTAGRSRPAPTTGASWSAWSTTWSWSRSRRCSRSTRTSSTRGTSPASPDPAEPAGPPARAVGRPAVSAPAAVGQPCCSRTCTGRSVSGWSSSGVLLSITPSGVRPPGHDARPDRARGRADPHRGGSRRAAPRRHRRTAPPPSGSTRARGCRPPSPRPSRRSPVAARSSAAAMPLVPGLRTATPASRVMAGVELDQARSEGPFGLARRSTIAAATTGTSALTCTA